MAFQNRIFLLLVYVFDLSLGNNILILSGAPSPSHSIWLRPLMAALAERGHNVTVVSPDVEKTPPANLTYVHLENLYSAMYNTTEKDALQFFDLANRSPFTVLRLVDQFAVDCCKHAIKSKGFKKLLEYPKEFRYDVFLSDYMAGPCLASLLMYRFGSPPFIPVVPYNGLTTSSPYIGSYSYSASIPNHVFDAPETMSFWERTKNLMYDSYESISKDTFLYPHADSVIKSIFPNAPSARELQNNIKLLFTNSNPLIQYKESLMPMVIPVGGMHILTPKPLPEDLSQVISRSKNGFILFSLGSNARSDELGSDRIRCILTAMKAFPQYQFLWKFESDESKLPMPVPENVFIRAWMPQNDLLAHPKIKLFITHSGLLSIQESVWHGVPVIGFPLFVDQFRNINYYTSIGVARRLSLQTFAVEELIEAIHALVIDSTYRTKMLRLSQHFRDQPETPLERAVWWVEWVLRNPDVDLLQSNAVNLWWFQKYLFDVFMFLLIAILSILIAFTFIVTRIFGKSSPISEIKGNSTQVTTSIIS